MSGVEKVEGNELEGNSVLHLAIERWAGAAGGCERCDCNVWCRQKDLLVQK